jgi:hypothetical protein
MQSKEAKNSESRDGDSLKTQVTQNIICDKYYLLF